MLPLGKSCFCTGLGNRRINRIGMAIGRDHLLRNQHCQADRAMLPLGKSCFCTGLGNRRIDHICMAKRGHNDPLARKLDIAHITINHIIV